MPQIPAGWEETTLQLCTLPVQEKISLTQVSEDNYISTENMLPNIWWVVISSGLPNINSITKFQKWDILFSNIRTYFRKLWYATFTGGVSNDVLVFRGNYSKIYSKFLFYRLSDNSFFDYTIKTSKWTKMPRWDKEAIWNFPIHLPPLPEQQAIAAVLSSFDDKIELLRAENQTLEQMGQELFKERFGKWKIGDELPEGWRVGKLGEEITPKQGKYIDAKYISDNQNDIDKYPIYWGSWIRGYIRTFDYSNPMTILTCRWNWCGLIQFTERYSTITNSCMVFDSESLWLTSERIYLRSKNINFESVISGSAQPQITIFSLFNISIIVPDQVTLSKFDLVIKPFFNKIRENSEQIQTLLATRDQLLPKLMSGEVRVAE